jgi:hypothetical protein
MRYLYYRIFSALLKVKTNDTPYLNAMILLIILQATNILTISSLTKYFYPIELSDNQAIYGSILLYIVLVIINYFYLFRNRDLIKRRYQNETRPKKARGIVILSIYIIITIAAFIITK